MALVDDLAAFLDARSTQVTPGTNLFVNELPEIPRPCLLVSTFPGIQNHVMGTGTPLAPVSAVVMTTFARSTSATSGTVPSSTSAERLLSIAYQQFSAMVDVVSTASGRRIYAALADTDPYYAGVDEAGRVCFEQRWHVTHRPLTTD